jgi:hypothetical protein
MPLRDQQLCVCVCVCVCVAKDGDQGLVHARHSTTELHAQPCTYLIKGLTVNTICSAGHTDCKTNE